MKFQMKEYYNYILIVLVFILALLLVLNKAKQVENICISNYENYIKSNCQCESQFGFDPSNINIEGLEKYVNKNFS